MQLRKYILVKFGYLNGKFIDYVQFGGKIVGTAVNKCETYLSVSLTETSEMEIASGLQKGEDVIYETGNADPKPERYSSKLDEDKDEPDDIIDQVRSRLSGCEMFLNNESGGKHLKDCRLADFLGSAFGSTVSSVYEKHFKKTHCKHDVAITAEGVKAKASKPIPPSEVLPSENKHVSSFQSAHTHTVNGKNEGNRYSLCRTCV